MSNGTKVILGLIMFALGMLIMVSAFCPPSWYGETDCAATSENKSNRRVVKCLRFSILIDRAGDSAYAAVAFDYSTVDTECGRQRRNQQKTREALSVTEGFPCLFLKK